MADATPDRAASDRQLLSKEASQVEDDSSPLKDLRNFMDTRVVLTSIIIILLWFAVAGLTYSFHLGWTFLESMYFLCTTLTTVGYGDVLPPDDASKLYTSLFIIVGMMVAGQAIGVALVELSHKFRERSDSQVLYSSCAIIFGFLCLGTLVFCLTEDLSFVDGFYLTVVTVTSVGYGDISPKSIAGRWFAIFFLLPATIATAQAMSAAAAVPMKAHKKKLELMVIRQYGEDLTNEELADLIQDPVGKRDSTDTTCSRNEFILKILVKLDKVNPKLLQDISAEFDRLDNDGSGFINLDDVVEIVTQRGSPSGNPG